MSPWSPSAPAAALDRPGRRRESRAPASIHRPAASEYPVPALLTLIAQMPLRSLHALGAGLGCLSYVVAPSYRACLRANLARALPDATLGRRFAAAAQTGRGALEVLSILLRPVREMALTVRDVVGWDAVEAERANGRGALLLSPHLGCVEILGPFLRDLPFTALYRPHKSRRLQSLMESGRRRYAKLAPADRGGVRAVACALKRGEIVLVLPDQVPAAGDGQWAPFFSRPAYTMTLAARLTEMTGVASFMFCGERLQRGAGYRLHFRPPDPPLEGSTRERVAAINRNVEQLVLRHPDQYLWGYDRYKAPPTSKPCSATDGAARASSGT